jgi:hypothetical protein
LAEPTEPEPAEPTESTAAEQPELSIEELVEHLKGLQIGQFLLSTVSTLVTLTFGKLDAGDLAQARVGVDAIGAIVPVLEGQVPEETKRELEAALAGLRIAYADAAAADRPESTL